MDTELITWITSILGELKGQNDQVLKNQEKIIEKVEQISDTPFPPEDYRIRL